MKQFCFNPLQAASRLLVSVLSALVRGYQWFISPLLGPHCRHRPTCSEYMHQALQTHGAGRGLWIGTRRLLRCRPWGTWGYDPVPAPQNKLPETNLKQD